ncbi:MAG: preprotein translocase subunit SecY [Verrucomicrobia bacterium GWF2_51_19]|nr:MAG: preprotein translocase subunit SecY [Verrucomicrobia bacterium GWF2_51_19]HCJ12591.1 preprotein translocase subunit SecY [Opitutae bacterium]
MISAFTNSLKIPELRQRILFTFALLFIARVGANIPIPGLDPLPLQTFFAAQSATSGNLVGLYNLFTGGAFLKGAIFGLGIMPYISASIIMQLAAAVMPSLAQLQQEGDVGRQKITQYTRYLTLVICLVQGALLTTALCNYPGKLFMGFDQYVYGRIVVISSGWFVLTGTIFLAAGTMLLTWLGDQITERGIGNGISLLITIGILSGMPQALTIAAKLFSAPVGAEGGVTMGLPQAFLMLVLLLVVIGSMIAVTQAQRKIPVQYAQRVVGQKMYGGQTSFLPLKINYAGVMPVIFASAILMFPQQIFAYIAAVTGLSFFQRMSSILTQGSATYYTFYGSMILGFSYFWVSIMFRPVQIADDLKKNGGYIPGVRPGLPTAKFLDFVMTRLTLAGAIFLTVIALFPDLLFFAYNIPYRIAMFFGGTGTLITVGVMLDTMRQIETYLLQRHYDGFLKKGRLRARSELRVKQLIDTEQLKNLGILWYPLLALFLLGLGAWIIRTFF